MNNCIDKPAHYGVPLTGPMVAALRREAAARGMTTGGLARALVCAGLGIADTVRPRNRNGAGRRRQDSKKGRSA